MTEPTTKAGRALLDWFGGPMRDKGGLVALILAVEAEALADAARRVEGVLQPGNEHGLTYQAGRNDGLRKAVAILTTPEEADR